MHDACANKLYIYIGKYICLHEIYTIFFVKRDIFPFHIKTFYLVFISIFIFVELYIKKKIKNFSSSYIVYIKNVYMCNYEWGKRMKFVLAIIYRLPRRYSKNSKTFKINLKKKIFMTILGLAESFKMIDRPDPTEKLFDGLLLRKYEI